MNRKRAGKQRLCPQFRQLEDGSSSNDQRGEVDRKPRRTRGGGEEITSGPNAWPRRSYPPRCMPRSVVAKGMRDSHRLCVAALHSSEPLISPCTSGVSLQVVRFNFQNFSKASCGYCRPVRGTDRRGTAPGAVAPQSRPAYKDRARAQGISPCPAIGTSRLIAPDAESLFPSAKCLLPKKSLR